jgi:carbon storage regulator
MLRELISSAFFNSLLARNLLLTPSEETRIHASPILGTEPQKRVRLKEESVMLVLSRKLGQSFHIGPEVRVTIVKIDRNSVRIGIEAPDDVSVQREEIAFEVPEPRLLKAGAA